MSREYWFFLAGMVVVALPLLAAFAVKKLNLFDLRPDREVTYKSVDGRNLALHAFFAQHTDDRQARPALILFHGGRWLYGHPRAFYPQCQFFAAKGYHCFAAQYRLGTNNRVDVKELVADASDALRYLHTEADTLGVDATRIFVGGGSAGGHLAAALGTRVPAADSPLPAGMVLFNPMLDLAPGTPDHHLVADYWESVSPAHNIKSPVPPTLILVGSDDPEVPVGTVNEFCSAVTQVKGRCEVEVYEGQSHGFFNAEPHRTKTNERALRFLNDL